MQNSYDKDPGPSNLVTTSSVGSSQPWKYKAHVSGNLQHPGPVAVYFPNKTASDGYVSRIKNIPLFLNGHDEPVKETNISSP